MTFLLEKVKPRKSEAFFIEQRFLIVEVGNLDKESVEKFLHDQFWDRWTVGTPIWILGKQFLVRDGTLCLIVHRIRPLKRSPVNAYPVHWPVWSITCRSRKTVLTSFITGNDW